MNIFIKGEVGLLLLMLLLGDIILFDIRIWSVIW
jgi:hypothetical protein